MSSPSNPVFECRWQASRLLLAAYLLAQSFALGALLLLDLPYSSLGLLLCLAHAAWVVPRHIRLTHRSSIRGLRRDENGWQLWSAARGWHRVQLRPDSLALPLIVVLRYRVQGEWAVRSICVPSDSQAADVHRRLRVRLKFSRRRWLAPE
ncbi:toxin CptA [Pseudomonas marginalis]|uniref:protein YgfX n=1 Tax=Pseudomonas marginalis TaxID=298 RepID=UPI0020A11658|nr:protein YgfX [Pseudomonas marginalis]MCP1505352.1 toxin CptA [Pseudomonas marginalis]MCP1522856.1 toxin CptA [Pseudomonas marginalis]MDQ0497826.1 toxin CptA [Pseudomonas marginalis]